MQQKEQKFITIEMKRKRDFIIQYNVFIEDIAKNAKVFVLEIDEFLSKQLTLMANIQTSLNNLEECITILNRNMENLIGTMKGEK